MEMCISRLAIATLPNHLSDQTNQLCGNFELLVVPAVEFGIGLFTIYLKLTESRFCSIECFSHDR